MDLNLALTKQTLDYEKLQQATGIISKIASINPIVYFGLEAINAGTGGNSNKYLNGDDDTNNPLLNTVSNLFNGIMGGNDSKQLEQPSSAEKLSPFPFQPISQEPVPYNQDNHKYSNFDSSNSTITKDDNENGFIQFAIPITIEGLILIVVIATSSKKK